LRVTGEIHSASISFKKLYVETSLFTDPTACVMHCGATVEEEAEAACAYLCEMTHGYENQAFLDLV